MAVRMDKPWRPLTEAAVAALPGQLGVYQIADPAGAIVYIGVAGGRSRFGLRGELAAELAARGPEAGYRFRLEVNTAYQTRHRELLMAYRADHGALPAENRERPPPGLGRLSPG